jgi:hypothetical protein
VKYVRYIGPPLTLVTGHLTGPFETGDVVSVADEEVAALVGEDVAVGEGEAAQTQHTGLWVALTDDEAKEYEANLKKAAKKTGIAKPEVTKKTEEVQSQQ